MLALYLLRRQPYARQRVRGAWRALRARRGHARIHEGGRGGAPQSSQREPAGVQCAVHARGARHARARQHEAATGSASPCVIKGIVWHGATELPETDLIVIPGGFSYGDYLRAGALAAHSPVMREVVLRADAGVPVLGICNGFQILTEAGLLPGVLMRNAALKFICKDVFLKVQNANLATRLAGSFGSIRVTSASPS